MAYQEQDLLVSRSRLYPSSHHYQEQQQKQNEQSYIPHQTLTNRNHSNLRRRSSPQSLRIECTAEERYLSRNPSSSINKSRTKVTGTEMNEENQSGQFRSEIVVHNDPDTDVHIKRLRIALHYHMEPPDQALAMHQTRLLFPTNDHLVNSSEISNQTVRQRSPQDSSSAHEQLSSRMQTSTHVKPPSKSQALLHQWIDDICANQELMSNDDIVFFIKNGEFFARI